VVTRSKLKIPLPKPFVKWVGGKGQLLSELLGYIPKSFKNYHEPFVGGGAVFFALHRAGRLNGKKVFLSDINQELITTYKAIRDDVEGVIKCLSKHKYERDYYYEIRALDIKSLSNIEMAARMIFLNKAGFNGLYRLNSKGIFNVPFGRYKNPTICDRDNLRAVSKALQGVELLNQSYDQTLKLAKSKDVVYFDPPYVPLSDTANFTSYTSKGFDLGDQENLSSVFKALGEKKVHAILSNSDTPWVRKQYKGHKKVSVQVSRSVNSKADKRGPVGELIVLANI
jgi:DNA adenine methylase